MGAAGSRALILALGMILDALFGEPRWLWSRLPHPAILMGNAVGFLDRLLNRGSSRWPGIIALVILVIAAALIGFALQALPGQIAEIVCLAVLLAQRSLCEHVVAVGGALRLSLNDARHMVARIVGRDTSNMEQSAVARSAIESAAENLSDGIIAPAFWFLIAGLPGLLIYKITNTADSMIGYKTAKYEDFGWASARFDDLLNLIPARFTALLIWVAAPNPATPAKIMEDAPRHRSPNAGWPEAAAAYHLDVALSGPRTYDGELKAYPYVNDDGRYDLTANDIDAAVTMLWKVWALAIFAVLVISLF